MGWLCRQKEQLLAVYREEGYLRWLRLTAGSFVALVVLSFVLGLIAPSLPAGIVEQFSAMVANSGIAEEDGRFSAMRIFLHNLQAMGFTLVYGLIPFLFLPALMLGTNAMMLGFVGAHYVNRGVSPLIYLAGILPHGIFELPALVLSLSCGLYLCASISGALRERKKGALKPVLAQLARILVLQIAPLLWIAAFVEAYITPVILQTLLK